jgi:hypothetical protein
VYAARSMSWRGIFAVHTWIVIKPTGAQRYTRYEVVGFGVANGAPAVRVDRMGPDNYWFGARPQIVLDRRGVGVDAMIDRIRRAVATYPYPHEYRFRAATAARRRLYHSTKRLAASPGCACRRATSTPSGAPSTTLHSPLIITRSAA